MEELEVIELVIDESNEGDGIHAISLVENPAIQENFVALSEHKVEFKSIDEDKRIVVGLALVPNKKIYRRRNGKEFYITFSEDTVRKSSELYLKRLNNNNATIEHEVSVDGVSVIESWIVDDPQMDKVNLYGLNPIKGAWAVVMKVYNDAVWEGVKSGDYLGLSIEGGFSSKEEELSRKEPVTDLDKAINILKNL